MAIRSRRETVAFRHPVRIHSVERLLLVEGAVDSMETLSIRACGRAPYRHG